MKSSTVDRIVLVILGEDFSMKEMRKTYDIPENASFEHMTSFLTAKGK